MRTGRSLLGLAGGLASALALGCGDDSGVVDPTGAEDSTTSELTTGLTTTGTPPDDTGDTGPMDSSGSMPTDDDGTTAADTTAADSSSGGPGAECGNDMVEGDEICDGADLAGEDCASQGFDGGTLGCATDCSAYDTGDCVSASCGNGILEDDEACDGEDFGGVTCESEGFDNGTPSCALDCSGFDFSGCGTCGNVIVEGSEVCDSIVFLGETCESQGFDSGTIGCNPDCLAYDFTGCGTCGNEIIDGDEICDGLNNNGETCLSLGFDSGTLGECDSDCEDFDTAACGTCGNGVIDGDEVCDTLDFGGETCGSQGFDSGSLSCAADCMSIITDTCGTCNNDIIDGAESCDGADLNGETCASLGLEGGDLSCNAVTCQYVFDACDIPGTLFGSDSGYNGYALTPGVLPCDDISATGTDTGLSDDGEIAFPMGFEFPIYGQLVTEITINANGNVQFSDPGANMTLTNPCMPGVPGFGPEDLVFAVFWDDLNPSSAGAVYYETLGPVGDQRFVVQWDVPHFGGDTADLIRVQAVFHQNGMIEACYPDTINAGNSGDNGAEATAGIQNNSTDGFEYSCDSPDLVDGLLLMYQPI